MTHRDKSLRTEEPARSAIEQTVWKPSGVSADRCPEARERQGSEPLLAPAAAKRRCREFP
jgi:hypothetical protein